MKEKLVDVCIRKGSNHIFDEQTKNVNMDSLLFTRPNYNPNPSKD